MDQNLMTKKYVKADEENLPIFKALSSKTRLQILALLRVREMSIKDLGFALNMSSSIITKHIKNLEAVDIVESYSKAGKHGLKKVCKIKTSELQVILNNNYEEDHLESTEINIPIGSFSAFHVLPPCGLASKSQLLGILDDPRYFVAPERLSSSIIWFTSGYLEYAIPIYEIKFDLLDELEISLEICSEFPGYNNSFKSDIYFSLNGIKLGMWRSPGDFGDKKGRYTPKWWTLGSEYGLLKMIRINENGVFLDGIQLSNIPLSEFLKEMDNQLLFRIECPTDTENPGGINLFGSDFGNFNQDIKVKCLYVEK